MKIYLVFAYSFLCSQFLLAANPAAPVAVESVSKPSAPAEKAPAAAKKTSSESQKQKKEEPKGKLIDGVAQRVGKARLILHSDVAEMAEELKWRKFPGDLLYPSKPSDPAKEQALNYLINKNLINEACEENRLVAGSEQIDAQLKSVIKNNPKLETEADLARALKAEGKELEDFREEISSQINMRNFSQRFIIPYVKVTEADLKPYYFLKTGEKAESISVTVEQVSFSCEEPCSEGLEAHKKLTQGESFEKVAKTLPGAPKVETETYDVNSLASDSMREALESLAEGAYTKPVLVAGNTYLFKLLSKKVTPSLGFDKESLKRQYMEELSALEMESQLQKLRVKHHLPTRKD